MKSVILAGGKGEGLWPLSRKDFPKQFLEINGESFFEQAVKRCLLVSKPKEIYVVTIKDYFFYVKKILSKYGINEKNIIIEPLSRSTASCMLFSLFWLINKKSNPDDIVFFCPSDQYVGEDKKFGSVVKKAAEFAKESSIVTFGVKPLLPKPDYGYIQKGIKLNKNNKTGINVHKIKKFVEKPSEKTAKKWTKDKTWYWNTGMLLFSIKTMLVEFEKFMPDTVKMLSNADFSNQVILRNIFKKLPIISIDKAVMEKTSIGKIVPVSFQLLDIGDWNLFYKMCPKDDSGNVKIGDVVAMDMKDSLIISEKTLIACSGMKDTAIIGTDDVFYVSDKKNVSKVKDIVLKLNEKGRSEAIERKTSFRPWGSYTILETSSRYKIKKISVNPGASLSLQMHNKRSEHWVVISGIANVRIGEEMILLQEGESTFVPLKSIHKLQNPGKKPLEIIEVQMGSYLGEDDIVRLEDPYGREKM